MSVVIHTLNEAGSLPWVLGHLPPWVAEVFLVDGLSSDGTERLTRRLRPDLVVVHQLPELQVAARNTRVSWSQSVRASEGDPAG